MFGAVYQLKVMDFTQDNYFAQIPCKPKLGSRWSKGRLVRWTTDRAVLARAGTLRCVLGQGTLLS